MGAITAVVHAVDVELGPLERKLGVAYVSDVQFDDPVTLCVEDHVSLRDVDDTVCDGVVSAVEDGKFCNRYRVKFTP